MNCPIADTCTQSRSCGHKDMAEYCSLLREKNPKEFLQAFEENKDVTPPPRLSKVNRLTSSVRFASLRPLLYRLHKERPARCFSHLSCRSFAIFAHSLEKVKIHGRTIYNTSGNF